MNLLLFLSAIYCSSPLSSPIFKKKGGNFTAELPFVRDVSVKSYEIMVGSLDAKENDYTTLDKKKDQQGIQESIIVNLDIIKNKDNKHLYSICVEEQARNKTQKWYSETFRWDARSKNWVLERVYEDDPWYIKHMYYVLGGSALVGLGLIGFILMRYMKKKNEDESL